MLRRANTPGCDAGFARCHRDMAAMVLDGRLRRSKGDD
jgi:hypothetical protein